MPHLRRREGKKKGEGEECPKPLVLSHLFKGKLGMHVLQTAILRVSGGDVNNRGQRPDQARYAGQNTFDNRNKNISWQDQSKATEMGTRGWMGTTCV